MKIGNAVKSRQSHTARALWSFRFLAISLSDPGLRLTEQLLPAQSKEQSTKQGQSVHLAIPGLNVLKKRAGGTVSSAELPRQLLGRIRRQPRNPTGNVLLVSDVFLAKPLFQTRLLDQRDVNQVEDEENSQ